MKVKLHYSFIILFIFSTFVELFMSLHLNEAKTQKQHLENKIIRNIINEERHKLLQTFQQTDTSKAFSIAMEIYTMSNILNLAQAKDQQRSTIKNNHYSQDSIKNQSIQCFNRLKEIVDNFRKQSWFDLFQQIYSDLKSINQKCSNLDFQTVVSSSSVKKFSSGLTNKCVLCTIVMRIIQNAIYLKSVGVANTVDYYVCDWFGGVIKRTCDGIVYYYGPNLISSIQNNQNPDVICRELRYCSSDNQCYLTDQDPSTLKHHLFNHKFDYSQQFNAPWQWISYLFEEKFTNQHQSPFDEDNDTFSTIATLRGYNWKGVDCDDTRSDVYPGRKPQKIQLQGIYADWDCNGIYGQNQFGQSLQNQLCQIGGTKRLGLALIGDSAGANFQFPDKYLNASLISSSSFDDFIYNLYNQFDNPQASAITGFIDNINSLYKNLKQWNQCNANDYQNLAINGASSRDIMSQVQKLKRQKSDWPMLVILELLGNDVCKTDLQSITPAQQFRQNIINFLKALDNKLPIGSHLIILGIPEGDKVYQTMAKQTHPLYVTYEKFYQFLNCLNMNPCKTWLNSNQDLRKKTTQKAIELNEVYKNVIQTTKFTSFDIAFYDFPLNQLLQKKIDQGGSGKDFICKTDGFHPNEQFNHYLGEWLWKKIKEEHSDWIGLSNANNIKIEQKTQTIHYQ